MLGVDRSLADVLTLDTAIAAYVWRRVANAVQRGIGRALASSPAVVIVAALMRIAGLQNI